MNPFKKRLELPYHKMLVKQQALLDQLDRVQQDVVPNQEGLPKLFERAGRTLDRMHHQQAALEKRMEPFDLEELHDAKIKLIRANRLSWFLPQAFKLRMLNALYRTGFILVRLVELSVVLLIIYLILRVIWWLA